MDWAGGFTVTVSSFRDDKEPEIDDTSRKHMCSPTLENMPELEQKGDLADELDKKVDLQNEKSAAPENEVHIKSSNNSSEQKAESQHSENNVTVQDTNAS